MSFLIFALSAGSCLELGQLATPGDYNNTGTDMTGEREYVDTGIRQIEIRTDAGRQRNVLYDNQTRVVYRQRDYAMTNLESGDYVALRAQQDRDGRLYTDLVMVRESAQDRGGSGRSNINPPDRFEGTVEYVDPSRGQFEVRARNNRLVVVALQYNAPRTVNERFNRLREGDAVCIGGRFLNQDRFELETFL